MVARWLQSKLAKRARERRAWAKPYSIKNSTGPNWHNGTQARETPVDPDTFLQAERVERLRKRSVNAQGQDVSRIPDIRDIRKEIPDPFFIVVVDTPYHRCRIYWNSQRTVFILQYVLWRQKTVKISIAYPTFTRAVYVFQTDRVRWRKHINF